MARDLDPFKLSSPRIFLVRMLVFLTLCLLLCVVLYKQIWTAFLANPGLNALILSVLIIGVIVGTQYAVIVVGLIALATIAAFAVGTRL